MQRLDLRRCLLVAWCAVGVMALYGCESSGMDRIDMADRAYRKGDFTTAYREAQQAMRSSQGSLKSEAAYMAGISAYRLKDSSSAVHYLKQASSSNVSQLTGDSLAMLGVIYAEQGKYPESVQAQLQAVRYLSSGPDRANAYYYAAKAQQKMGQWSQAKANLRLARSASRDEAFRHYIGQELDVGAFTLQIGAFTDHTNAQRAAENLATRASTLKLDSPRLVPAKDAQRRELTLVQVGRFPTYADAESVRQQLRPLTAIVVSLAGSQ